MIRLGVGGLMHESNTFATARTTLESFVSGGLEVGEGIRKRWGDAHHEVGGVLDAAHRADVQYIPTLMGWATPSGPLDSNAYETLSQRLLDAIRDSGPLDAMVVCLHGAMVADGVNDADGRLVSRIRALLGPTTPLVVTLDFHGNISPLLISSVDAAVAYQTYPHIDQRERGLAAGNLAIRAARKEVVPVTAISKPPVLVHLLKQATGPGQGPFSELIRQAELVKQSEPRILDVSLMAGFPYADVASAGVSCIVVADGDRELAQSAADQLAQAVWDRRLELTDQPPDAPAAIREALAQQVNPVLLIDLGDNIGGGSAADSTVLLHEIRRQNGSGVVAVIFDPDAVASCTELGVGSQVNLDVGGKIDRNAPPYLVQGTVVNLHDGAYVEELPRHGGIRHNAQGATAVIQTTEGNTIVVNSLRHPPFSLGQLTSLGIDPLAARLIIVKAAVAYRAAYEPVAGAIIEVDTPGLTASNPARFNYKNIKRPIFPLDPETPREPSRP